MRTFICNVCGGHEVLSHRDSPYVCPWCAEGVMQPEEEEEDDNTEQP